MCSDKVIELMKSIPYTNGTVAYLTVMQFVISAFNDHDINIKDRVYKLWFAVFFLENGNFGLQTTNPTLIQLTLYLLIHIVVLK